MWKGEAKKSQNPSVHSDLTPLKLLRSLPKDLNLPILFVAGTKDKKLLGEDLDRDKLRDTLESVFKREAEEEGEGKGKSKGKRTRGGKGHVYDSGDDKETRRTSQDKGTKRRQTPQTKNKVKQELTPRILWVEGGGHGLPNLKKWKELQLTAKIHDWLCGKNVGEPL